MQTYLYMNLLIVAGFASMQLFALFFKAFGRRASDRIVLNTNYVLMGACLMIPFVVLVIPAESVTIVKSFAPEVSVTQPLTDLMTDLPTLKQADIMIQRHGSWLDYGELHPGELVPHKSICKRPPLPETSLSIQP